MRTPSATLALAIAICGGISGLAEEPPRLKAAPEKLGLPDLLRFGEMSQAARDLRQAGEAWERFGKSLEGTGQSVAPILKGVSKSIANIGRGFDPLGLQAAFRTIRQQNRIIVRQQQTIERIHKEQIDHLREELQKLRTDNPTGSEPVRRPIPPGQSERAKGKKAKRRE